MTRSSGSRPNLTDIPPELLGQILAQIETAHTLTCLSQTCKGLHAYVEKDGYRVFVQHRFPSIIVPPSAIPPSGSDVATVRKNTGFWKYAAHGLTTLSRNWDRRAFVAQAIQDPEATRRDTPTGRSPWRRRRGPTIGFIPVIDSYEAWYEAGWTSRKEVVAWGAGARLVVRSAKVGPRVLGNDASEQSNWVSKNHWRSYMKEGALEGRDDITTLNLIPKEIESFEDVLLGRASGSLELLRLEDDSVSKTRATYNTAEDPVRYATIHGPTALVAAVSLGDQNVSLYPLDREGYGIEPCASTSVRGARESPRTWSSKFLSSRRLAVGVGRSAHPIHIYDVGQGSSSLEHMTRINLGEGITANRVDSPDQVPYATSIYSFASLPPSSTSSGTEGELFLSGGYDAHVRLHDLRLSHTVVSLFSDPVDASSAIYSLLPIGCERFVAGGALHSLIKVFDLRMPGQKMYHAANALSCSPRRLYASDRQESSQSDAIEFSACGNRSRCAFHESIRTPRNWNVFLGTRNRGQDRSFESPVYALTRPSSVSPTIYAGIQDNILQLDFISVLDHYPDTIHSSPPPLKEPAHSSLLKSPSAVPRVAVGSAIIAPSNRWGFDGEEIMNLPMYEQANQVKLMHQQPVTDTWWRGGEDGEYLGRDGDPWGLDERWGASSLENGS